MKYTHYFRNCKDAGESGYCKDLESEKSLRNCEDAGSGCDFASYTVGWVQTNVSIQ